MEKNSSLDIWFLLIEEPSRVDNGLQDLINNIQEQLGDKVKERFTIIIGVNILLKRL